MKKLLLFFILFIHTLGVSAQNDARPANWLFRNWPDDKELLEIVNQVPNLNTLDPTMFRYVFGSMPVRLSLTPGGAQALVIGQDGTHGAEIAGEPFNGAGTGGRGQHMVYHMTGTDEGIYMNTFTYTIRKQYGDFAPLLITNADGKTEIQFRTLLSPQLYLLAQDLESSLVKWRNKLIDHVLKKNPNIEIILGYGGAARDTIASYMESKGVKLEQPDLTKTSLLAYECMDAGGNKTFCFPVDEKGKNLLILKGEKDVPLATLQKRANDKTFLATILDKVKKVPITYPGQLGKNLNSQGVDGVRGLFNIKVGRKNRIIMAKQGRHPGAVQGGTGAGEIEKNYQKLFSEMIEAQKAGYLKLNPESPMLKGVPYVYSHRDIPGNKVFASQKSSGPSTDASRSGKQVINFGGRDKPEYNADELKKAQYSVSKETVKKWMEGGNIPWEPSRENDYEFHHPVMEWIKFLSEKMQPIQDAGEIYKYVKNSKDHGYFGVYRGNFEEPETIILSDSSIQDLDAMISGMALSGPNGRKLQQYLNGEDIDKYLILNLLPFDMTMDADADQASVDGAFNKALDITKPWYDAVLNKLFEAKNKPTRIITIGKYAKERFKDVLNGVTVEHIDSLDNFKGVDIPRGDLFHGERMWMGRTENTTIIRSTNFPGKIYGWVAPSAVAYADVPVGKVEKIHMSNVLEETHKHGFSAPFAPRLGGTEKTICDELSSKGAGKDTYKDEATN